MTWAFLRLLVNTVLYEGHTSLYIQQNMRMPVWPHFCKYLSHLNIFSPNVADFKYSSILSTYFLWLLENNFLFLGRLLDLRHRKFEHMPWFTAHHHHWPFNLVPFTSFPAPILSPFWSMGNIFLVLRKPFYVWHVFEYFLVRHFCFHVF